MNETKWKNFVLKTGLPLEYEVIKIINSIGFRCNGEFPYIKENENGFNTEFSIDIWAETDLKNINIENNISVSCLIECKYSHRGISWLFMPNNNPSSNYLIKIVDHNSSVFDSQHSIEKSFLKRNKFNYCFKGIEIHQNDASDFIIKKGISQLKYALPNIASNYLDIHYHVDPTSIAIILPILVTTADIFLLNKNVTIDDIYNTDIISSIAQLQDAIILSNLEDPLVERYSEKIIIDFLNKNESFEKDFNSIYKLKYPDTFESSSNYFLRFFRGISREILICNINSLYSIIQSFVKSIKKGIFDEV